MLAERGLPLAHTTIMRWVQRYAPEFVKRWNQWGRPVGRSWRVDETYVKIRGEWRCLYRAVDRAGKTVDFHLSANGTSLRPRPSSRRRSRARVRLRRLRWMGTRPRI